MPIRLHFPILLLFANVALGQITGRVIDDASNTPVPYVNIWVENGTVGTTANENGEFTLHATLRDQPLVFSAVGYETKTVTVDRLADAVRLIAQPLELPEIRVGTRKECELKSGRLKGRQVAFIQHSKDGQNGTPYILARYFENTCDKPLFLKKVKIKTSASKNATFNLRFYSVGDDGAPKDFLYDKNLLAEASRVKMSTTVDLKNLKIQVPDNGIFIAIEWLIIDENKRVPESKYNASTVYTLWDPGITAVENPGNTDSWINSGGRWKRQEKHTIAMEVEMTN